MSRYMLSKSPLRWKTSARQRYRRFFLLICCIIAFYFLVPTPSAPDDITRYKLVLYNLSDSFVVTNAIDQFLNEHDQNERAALWSLLIRSWYKSFTKYLQRSEKACPTLAHPLIEETVISHYANRLLHDNTNLQRNITGFGLFFDYHPEDIRGQSHHILHNSFQSPCTYFKLISLIMKTQLLLHQIQTEYFIGRNTLLGAMRHHDIVPWDTIVELNVPFESREKLLNILTPIEIGSDEFQFIHNEYNLIFQPVNGTYVRKSQIGFIYKVFTQDSTWPQVEIYFYYQDVGRIFEAGVPVNDDDGDEDMDDIAPIEKIGQIWKSDIFPVHLRPFGPLLMPSANNPRALLSPPVHTGTEQFKHHHKQMLTVCESALWDHRLGQATDDDHRWRMPCEQLNGIYTFAEARHSWRRGYCEETLRSSQQSKHIFSYFRYVCRENILNKK